MNWIVESGVIDASGKLLLPMDRVNEFLRAHKGMRAVARFEAMDHGTSQAMRGYYYGYVLPTVAQAMNGKGERMRLEECDRLLVREFPRVIFDDFDNEIEFARDFNAEDMSEFLEWLMQYAAENLSVYVENPKAI